MALLTAFLDWIFYGLSYLVPRNPNLWIFIGWRRSKEREVFAENPKYQFLYVARNVPEVRPIWIGQDEEICTVLRARGYKAYSIHSLQGIYYSLRAGYTFVGGLLQRKHWRFAGTTRLIQLWHSKSLKKTGYNSPYGITRYNRFLSGNLFHKPYKFIAISEFLAPFITSDFHIPKKDILITGIPKHDALLTEVFDSDIDLDQNLAKLINQARDRRPGRLLFYGPTFRPDGSNPLADFDLASFDTFLQGRNDICIISLHPKFSTRDWIPEGKSFTNILFSQSDLDIYPLMRELDVLITDYSSLTFDFLLMKKPLILYAFDIDTFKEGMGVYDALWDVMPGKKVHTFPALLDALSEDLTIYTPDIEAAWRKVFTFGDGKAAKRITDALRDSAQ